MTQVQLPRRSLQTSSSPLQSPRYAMFGRVERALGDTELSYFLPSRESGVNDMILHLGCRAPRQFFERDRVRLVWALLRMRHPLLASKVEMHSYTDIRFVYSLPQSIESASNDADLNLEYRTQARDELVESFTNGPRTLSQDRLSYLAISHVPRDHLDKPKDKMENYDIVICFAHFMGDGMGAHELANDFLCLLGGSCTTEDIAFALSSEWQTRSEVQVPTLPTSLEERLPPVNGQLGRLVSLVDYQRSQEKLIGGHVFPRRYRGPRRTIIRIRSIDEKRTRDILQRCKSHEVSMSSAVFALCNIAWAKTSGQNQGMPMMIYSALNLRPSLMRNKALNDSYMYIALSYFNVVLPSFVPPTGNLAPLFWHRARSAKAQSNEFARSPMVVSRIREMARERGSRARAWAKEDDDKARGVWAPPSSPPVNKPAARAPSDALIGVSLFGNLDGIYKHAAFRDIKIHSITSIARQRPGGILLFSYTFIGKLWLNFGYDENGIDKDVVERFWNNLSAFTDEFLMSDGEFRSRL